MDKISKTKKQNKTNKQTNKKLNTHSSNLILKNSTLLIYYLYITENILENAITFAKTFISINNSDLRIVKHCRKLSQNYCSLVKKFVRKSPQQAVSTLPWKAITAPKYINLSVSTSYHTFKQ